MATFDCGNAAPPPQFDPHIALTVTIDEVDGNWARGLGVVDVLDGVRRGVAREINLHIVPLAAVPDYGAVLPRRQLLDRHY